MKQSIVIGWLVLTMAGCAVDVEPGVESLGDVAQVEQRLTGGKVANKRGVVQVEVEGEGRQTGVMINQDHVLTAQIYGPDDPTEDGWNFVGEARIAYFDPDLGAGERRYVTGAMSEGDFDLVEITTAYGVSLIRRPGGWIDTGASDYQRLSRGSCSDIRTGNFYGRGTGGSGHPASVLRTISYSAELSNECNAEAYWAFWDFGTKATCPGDLGGPFIAKAGDYDVVTGILYDMWGGTSACDNGGANRSATRLGDWLIPWIEEVIGETCHEYTVDGHPYVRCWD